MSQKTRRPEPSPFVAPQDYYRYREIHLTFEGETYRLISRPGIATWDQLDIPTQLLLEEAVIHPTDRVLIIGCGNGLLGLVAARQATEGHVILTDVDAIALGIAHRTLLANGITNASVVCADGSEALPPATFDIALLILPKGKTVWEGLILDALHALRPGGTLYLTGAKKEGILTAIRFLETFVPTTETLGYRKRYRIVRAQRPADFTLPPHPYHQWEEREAEIAGTHLRFATRPGVFSWEHLDEGTRVLIETLSNHPLAPDDYVLDLGCGTGLLTVWAARQAHAGHVIGVDIDARAVAATQRTLALNNIANATVIHGNSIEPVRNHPFTAVVCNPPFHQGQRVTYHTARQFIFDAASILPRGGRLYLVANTFLKYDRNMEEVFGRVEALYKDERYTVWYAIKHGDQPRRTPRRPRRSREPWRIE